jgi:signal transduction histidine kinase
VPDVADPSAPRIRPEPFAVDEQPSVFFLVFWSLLVTVPLAWRRRFPLAVFLVQFLAGLVLESDNTWPTFVATLIGLYTLVVAGRSLPLSIGVAATIGVGATLALGDIDPPIPDTDWANNLAIILPVVLFGVAIRALRARAEALRESQEASTRAAVSAERDRIARELHDVVSHHVSVMVIQAGAAGKVIDTRPELAREALDAVQDSGRAAMTELRHLLGLLSPDAEGSDLLRPQPGLDQLDPLVEKVRAAGQPVTLRTTPVELPHGVQIVAYRVVQEGLTNALRYAPGAPTTVSIEADAEALTIEVINDAPVTKDTAPVNGTGSGLAGLTERLRLYGGTLQAGRRLGGGFRVSARIPLEAS